MDNYQKQETTTKATDDNVRSSSCAATLVGAYDFLLCSKINNLPHLSEFRRRRHTFRRSLHSLLEFLRSVSESDSTIHLFSHPQSVPQLQVLFQHSLKEPADGDNRVDSLNHIFDVEPMNITSPSTDSEIAVALRVLEGCCLLHKPSTVFGNKYNAINGVGEGIINCFY
ncbi:hypothetical protein ACFE04_025140 [Oxalis oulophora]